MSAQEELRLFASCQADLGESPVWDEAQNSLLFVDISGGQINALDQQANLTRLYESPSRIGALALTQKGNLIFAQNAGVAILDRTSLRVIHNSKLAITLSSYRFNDGACDPQGRFVTGLMDEGHSRSTGKLYRYDAGLNASVMLDHISLPNGLAWSIDGTELFLSTQWPVPFTAPVTRPTAVTWNKWQCLPRHLPNWAARTALRWTRRAAFGSASSTAAACSGTTVTAS